MTNRKSLQIITLALIIFHTLTVALHSAAHEILAVKATAAQLAFIIPVIIVAPLIAAALLWKFEKTGVWLMTVSLSGSFFFGLYYHFVAHTIDHVSHVASLQPAVWSSIFIGTAYLLAAGDLIGAIIGALLVGRRSQVSEKYAA